jgi:FkbM family methyltransferase
MSSSRLQQIGAWIGEKAGRESLAVRMLRPAYERLLDVVSGGKGHLATINGSERFYVNPRHRAWYGAVYEPGAFAYLEAHVKPGAVILNVGAHVGVYALSMASWVGRSGHVYAFEPNPQTREIFEDQIARNDFSDRITVVPLAVGGRSGAAEFSASGAAGFSRLGSANPARTDPHASVVVQITTIDDFCAARRIAPDWITLDIEGYETAALAGARRTITSRPGLQLMVELHPALWPLSATSRHELQQLLGELRLNVRTLTGQIDPFAEDGVVALTTSLTAPSW